MLEREEEDLEKRREIFHWRYCKTMTPFAEKDEKAVALEVQETGFYTHCWIFSVDLGVLEK